MENKIQIHVSKAPDAKPERKHSPPRLMKAVKLMTGAALSGISVKGKEHLAQIPPGAKVILAASHISDMDMPIAVAALGDDFDILVTDQSVHKTDWKEAPTLFGMYAAGIENFLQIAWYKDGDAKRPAFRPEDFLPMKEKMEQGKAILMAAHNPSRGTLPKPGIGVPYLASLVPDAVTVPVTVSIEHPKHDGTIRGRIKALFQRPRATVTIGKPILPEKSAGKEVAAEAGRLNRAGLDVRKLREDARNLMVELAKPLSDEQKGAYGSPEKR